MFGETTMTTRCGPRAHVATKRSEGKMIEHVFLFPAREKPGFLQGHVSCPGLALSRRTSVHLFFLSPSWWIPRPSCPGAFPCVVIAASSSRQTPLRVAHRDWITSQQACERPFGGRARSVLEGLPTVTPAACSWGTASNRGQVKVFTSGTDLTSVVPPLGF